MVFILHPSSLPLYFVMKKRWVLTLLLLVFAAVPARQLQTGVLALTHVTVIDMTGAPPQHDVTLLINDNRISAMGPSAQMQIPPGAQVIDATRKFLIPGLWDMHVHFTETDRSFPMFIANGVTGVRNMGAI